MPVQALWILTKQGLTRFAAFVSDYKGLVCLSACFLLWAANHISWPNIGHHHSCQTLSCLYHETIITTETSLFACFWGRLKCDKPLTHRASNDQRNIGIFYSSQSILSSLQSKPKKFQLLVFPLTHMQSADLKVSESAKKLAESIM